MLWLIGYACSTLIDQGILNMKLTCYGNARRNLIEYVKAPQLMKFSCYGNAYSTLIDQGIHNIMQLTCYGNARRNLIEYVKAPQLTKFTCYGNA